MAFSFVRRCVSSPEIIPIKPGRTVAVSGAVSIARAAMHRRSKAYADPLCPKEEGATSTHSVHRLARACVLASGVAPPKERLNPSPDLLTPSRWYVRPSHNFLVSASAQAS